MLLVRIPDRREPFREGYVMGKIEVDVSTWIVDSDTAITAFVFISAFDCLAYFSAPFRPWGIKKGGKWGVDGVLRGGGAWIDLDVIAFEDLMSSFGVDAVAFEVLSSGWGGSLVGVIFFCFFLMG